MAGRVEDLLFRAHRAANAARNRTSYRDSLFGDDLQLLRRTMRTFIQDSTALPGLIDWLDRECTKAPELLDTARGLQRVVSAFEKELQGLSEQMRLLHHHIIANEQKIEAWYMVQDLEILFDKVKLFSFGIVTRVYPRLKGEEERR